MRAFILLTTAVLLAIGVGIAVLVATDDARSGVATSRDNSNNQIVLLGDGVGAARFDDGESMAITATEQLFGRPNRAVQNQSVEENCGIDASLSWPTIEIFFDRGRFVGYAVGTYNLQPVDAATAGGLRIGEPLAKARQIYGSDLRTSSEQNGAWFAQTSTGTVDGFLSENPAQSSATAKILSIEAGDVGCPAMSP